VGKKKSKGNVSDNRALPTSVALHHGPANAFH